MKEDKFFQNKNTKNACKKNTEDLKISLFKEHLKKELKNILIGVYSKK
ncbi:hypothetical protein QUF99_19590 [Bacillus sp. DX4.1]|nr:hypothetical protein [Bacillus sp. DX4.1]MDM5189429.1 hypothetical protein [Bacillus sp. DX4.1]